MLSSVFTNFFDEIRTALTGEGLVIAILDVLAVAVLLYLLFMFLKKHNAIRLIKYLVAFLVLSAICTSALSFSLLGRLFSYSSLIVIVCVIIIFPEDLRRSVFRLASPKELQSNFTTTFNCSDEELKVAISDIVRAMLNMAKKNVGALIIIAPDIVPTHILESGTELDSKISVQLFESIFNTKAPLHDGAVFVKGNRILAAGCFLPLSQNYTLDKELGTRHRAAIGVTENHNVLALIVSEETGVISTAYKGEIIRYYDSYMLTDILEQVYGLKANAATKKTKKKTKKETTQKNSKKA